MNTGLTAILTAALKSGGAELMLRLILNLAIFQPSFLRKVSVLHTLMQW